MDCPLPVVSDDGDLPWSDSNMSSDDDQSMDFEDRHQRWIDTYPTHSFASSSASATLTACTVIAPASASASHMSHAGQLSPISTGMDITMTGDGSQDSSCPSSAIMAPEMVHSASSSCAGSWTAGHLDSDDQDGADGNNEDDWRRRGSDDILTVPKLEPMDDDDFCMDAFKDAPMTLVPSNPDQKPAENAKVKRPRGRPRKHPVAPVPNLGKITKGRSKTGCLTCRKRKKKCDEAKPACMNCQKNSVVCEGYPEKSVWKSGREKKAEEEAIRATQNLPVITRQPIFAGLETVEDRIFWTHYNERLSTVLTAEPDQKTAFKEIMIPIATKHRGLMHSILSLGGKHLLVDLHSKEPSPYGINMLENDSRTSLEALQKRVDYHVEQSQKAFFHMGSYGEDEDNAATATVSRFAQLLCRLLETGVEGNVDGAHRVHLGFYQSLIRSSPPQDPEFLTFITEFFQYQIFADELIRYPYKDHPDHSVGEGHDDDDGHVQEQHKTLGGLSWQPPQRLADEDWTPPPGLDLSIRSARLMGVADGLFNHLCAITSIRNRIRDNMKAQVDMVLDYSIVYQAFEIEGALDNWVPSWPQYDSRHRLGLLYKQMMWVYLCRTVTPPSGSPAMNSAASSAESLATATDTSATTAKPSSGFFSSSYGFPVVQTPPPSTSPTSCSSSPELRPNSACETTAGLGFDLMHQHEQHHDMPHGSPRRHSIAHPLSMFPPSEPSMPTPKKSATFSSNTAANLEELSHDYRRAHHHQQRAESPPPIRHPPNQDPRITLAVEEGLTILETFKPSDPVQTLLLMPCLVIGVACFSPSQQTRVLAALHSVKRYTGLRNADCVERLLQEVWNLMRLGDWAAAWDWQRVAAVNLKLDFLCA